MPLGPTVDNELLASLDEEIDLDLPALERYALHGARGVGPPTPAGVGPPSSPGDAPLARPSAFDSRLAYYLGPHATQALRNVAELSPMASLRDYGEIGAQAFRKAFGGDLAGALGMTPLAAMALMGSHPGGRAATAGSKLMGRSRKAAPFEREELSPFGKTHIMDKADIEGTRLDIEYAPGIPGQYGTPYEINFFVEGAQSPAGARAAGVDPKAGPKILATVEESLDRFVKDYDPAKIGFSAGAPELIPLYDRVAKRVAKRYGGEVLTEPGSGAYEISFRVDEMKKTREEALQAMERLGGFDLD